jgi:predicted DCC family thiol-disulfide oxidoreductase YuxK
MVRMSAAQSQDVVLFDGECRICIQGVNQLRRWVKPEDAALVSFRDEGALERFPGLTADECEQAMQLVRKDGRVFSGAEAIVQVLRHRAIGTVAKAYYAPGLRQFSDAVYRYIAKRRFQIAGRSGGCKDGTCHLHGR